MIAGDKEQAEVDPDDESALFEEVYRAKQQDLNALEAKKTQAIADRDAAQKCFQEVRQA